MKKCSKCHNIKSLSEFGVDRSKKGGFTYQCKQCRNEKSYEYYLANKKVCHLRHRKWIHNNMERAREIAMDAYRRNPRKTIERNCRYKKKRRLIDPAFKLRESISRAVNRTLKGNKGNKKSYSLLNFTEQELRNHIEVQFVDGMTWDNYGEWHLDHIRPIASFDIESHEDSDFKVCWALNNLQPLWAKDNMAKGAKWI